jgi:hypothetical protein
MASDPRLGSRGNPIPIGDEDHECADTQTSPDMTVFPMVAEGTVGNRPHGLPSNFSVDDDQRTVSTEVATPPPALTEDMAEGNLHAQPPGIGRAEEQEDTDSGIPPGTFVSSSIETIVLLLIDMVQNLSMPPPLTASICPDDSLLAFPKALILSILSTLYRRMRSRSRPGHLGLPIATTLVTMHQNWQQKKVSYSVYHECTCG